MSEPRLRELGDFLRSRRSRLSPQAAGLGTGPRRRTPGLRREEVAQLANIGIDWYVRLEQGRAVNPSAATIDALARALHLSEVEHAHLRALAHGPPQRPFQPEVVPPTVRRLVEGLNLPAYVTGRRWDVLAWNQAADTLFGFGQLAPDERNSLISVLTRPQSRRLFGAGWAEQARRMVEQFRATHDLWAGDPALQDLLARLRAGCPEFAGWWDGHDIRKPVAGRKVLNHRDLGQVAFDYATFQANDDPDLKLVIYCPI